MAYSSKNFSVMAYANGFTLWNYSTEDNLSVVKGNGYFNEVAPFARQGDMILVVANKGSSIETGIIGVANIANEAVTVADFISVPSQA